MNKDIFVTTHEHHKPAHPLVFFFLVLPFGISGGYVTVTLAYLFSKVGISVESIAGFVAASLLPQVFKFLWAPLVDTTLSLKKWYLLSGIITAASLVAMGIFPVQASSIPVLTVIVFVSNFAVSFLGIAVNGLAAHDTPDELKGRVSGFLQAGNVGGAGLGGGAGLWLAEHLPGNWMPASILALSCLLCAVAILHVKEYPSTVKAESAFKTIKNLLKDIWGTLKTRLGVFAMILCFLPLGTGAASNLWAAIAQSWGASANTVAFATGIMGGVITTVGCFIGGWACDRYNRQMAYVAFGLLQVLCAAGMAFAPHTQFMYIVWTSLYSLTIGLTYAGFSAFVFEAIGRGAAASKFTVYASLSNAPIYYMTLVEGWGHTRFGPAGMLYTEAVCATLGIILFLGLVKYAGKEKVALA